MKGLIGWECGIKIFKHPEMGSFWKLLILSWKPSFFIQIIVIAEHVAIFLDFSGHSDGFSFSENMNQHYKLYSKNFHNQVHFLLPPNPPNPIRAATSLSWYSAKDSSCFRFRSSFASRLRCFARSSWTEKNVIHTS